MGDEKSLDVVIGDDKPLIVNALQDVAVYPVWYTKYNENRKH